MARSLSPETFQWDNNPKRRSVRSRILKTGHCRRPAGESGWRVRNIAVQRERVEPSGLDDLAPTVLPGVVAGMRF